MQQLKPYKFSIVINSNAEPEDNHLKMLLQVEWPVDYPQSVPFCLLKNMAPDYLDNKMLDDYEQEIRKKAHETLGDSMMFDICEILRERIADLNDTVVNKYKGIVQAQEDAEREAATPKTFVHTDPLNYTPVTQETFSKWCDDFLEKLRQQEENDRSEQDLRKTGK